MMTNEQNSPTQVESKVTVDAHIQTSRTTRRQAHQNDVMASSEKHDFLDC